jgi:uncharacterized protein involved in exopolysaccharide biosynthesis
MSENTYEAPQADDEISLLDLLSTLTENLRLLILGPLLAGVAALGFAFVITPTFESRAVLRFDGAAGLTNEAAGVALASDDLLAAA